MSGRISMDMNVTKTFKISEILRHAPPRLINIFIIFSMWQHIDSVATPSPPSSYSMRQMSKCFTWRSTASWRLVQKPVEAEIVCPYLFSTMRKNLTGDYPFRCTIGLTFSPFRQSNGHRTDVLKWIFISSDTFQPFRSPIPSQSATPSSHKSNALILPLHVNLGLWHSQQWNLPTFTITPSITP